MGYQDVQLLLEDTVGGRDISAFTTAGSPYESTNAIDLTSTSPDQIGDGNRVEVSIIVTEDVTSAGAATMNFELVTATDAALTGTPTVLAETGDIAKADLLAGKVFNLSVPVQRLAQRYLGVRYNVGTANLTDGELVAGIFMDVQLNDNSWVAENGN